MYVQCTMLTSVNIQFKSCVQCWWRSHLKVSTSSPCYMVQLLWSSTPGRLLIALEQWIDSFDISLCRQYHITNVASCNVSTYWCVVQMNRLLNFHSTATVIQYNTRSYAQNTEHTNWGNYFTSGYQWMTTL